MSKREVRRAPTDRANSPFRRKLDLHADVETYADIIANLSSRSGNLAEIRRAEQIGKPHAPECRVQPEFLNRNPAPSGDLRVQANCGCGSVVVDTDTTVASQRNVAISIFRYACKCRTLEYTAVKKLILDAREFVTIACDRPAARRVCKRDERGAESAVFIFGVDGPTDAILADIQDIATDAT